MNLALLALTLSAFAIGTTEFVIVGLIPTIANDLSVSLPSAGLLVSLYALGVAVGAPVLTALTAKWNRKHVLLALMSLFVVGNLAAWQAPNYETLIIARIITGLTHGVFFSIGSTIATSLVSKEKAASAIAIMFTGLTVALVTGVPLGTYIGQEFGWRTTFLIVSLLGILSIIGSFILIPNNLKKAEPVKFLQYLKVITNHRLILVYLKTALGYGGVFLAFTYIAPILQEVSQYSETHVSVILLLYGVSVAIGNIWGGKLADKLGPVKALKVIFSLLALTLIVFSFTASSHYGSVITLMILGVFAFANVPPLQVYVVQLAKLHTPHAVDVASGLNIAAFNVGIAFGAWAGSHVVTAMQITDTAWIGGLVVALALVLTVISYLLDRKVS